MEGNKISLGFDDIIKFKNSKEFILLEQYYNNVRTLDLFNYYGQENPHTNFLANLFKENNPYTNNSEPFKLFLGLLSVKADALGLDCTTLKEVYLNSREIKELEVFSQLPLGSKRTDITFKFTVDGQKYVIILEAKIRAGEFEAQPYNGKLLKQTELYRTLAEEQPEYQDCKKYYVFLSPFEKPDISDSQHWIAITYQHLVDYVLSPCAIVSSTSNVPLTIDEYIKSYSNSVNKTNLGDFRLAITPEEIHLVESLWKNYDSTLKAIRDIAASVQNTKVTNSFDIENIISIFYENNKIILMFIYETLYKLNYIEEEKLITLNRQRKMHYFHGEALTNVDLFYRVVKDIVETECIKNIEQLNDIVIINNWKYLTDDLNSLNEEEAKWLCNYRTHLKNQNPIMIGNKPCYYWTYFPEADIQKFIEAVKRIYPKYNSITLN